MSDGDYETGYGLMTVSLSLPFCDGFVVAADSRTVSEQLTYSDETPKLYLLGGKAILAVCGAPFFNATIGNNLQRTIADTASWDDIECAFNRLVEEEVQKGQVFQRLAEMKYRAWFLLVGKNNGECLQRYASYETAFVLEDWNQFPYAVLGDEYGVRLLLNRLYQDEMPLDKAKLLAVLCVNEISKVNRSVGLPVQLGVVNFSKAYLLEQGEVEQLSTVAEGLDWKVVLNAL